MSAETVVRCGCGAELVTTDPVNRRASYQCPECLAADVRRVMDRWPS